MCLERLLLAFARWQPFILFDIAAHPILELIVVIHNRPCEHSSKLQLSIRFTPSRSLDVRQDWYPMYYPEGMKARVSLMQSMSIEPHRILAPTRDSNQEPQGPQSRLVTTTVHYRCRYLSSKIRHCGLVVSAPAWDGTGREFDTWQCRIYPMFIEPTITWVPSGFSGYIWLDTKIVLKKIRIRC